MAIPGGPSDASLSELHATALERAAVPLDFFDAHTHLGHNDPDGYTATPEQIVAGLDSAGQRRGLIFPMQEPDGYPGPNDAAIAAARDSGGRLEALARIDPNLGDGALAEAERCLAAGAKGFKLHPRSDAFDMPHPVVERVIALAQEHRAPVLFHAGRGFPGLGEEVANMARRHPDARIILAHAGISDLGHLGAVVAEAPNIFFDTSWWLVGDMLTLFGTVPPGRILYASDMPYGSARYSVIRDLRCAAQLGLEGEVLQSIAGQQLERILAGEDPLDLGPAPGFSRLGERDLVAERGIAYLATACTAMFRGYDPAEPLSLARLATSPSQRPEVVQADALIAQAQELVAAHPDDPRQAVYPAMAAQLVLGTPAAS
ncbi:MAG: amidohydrolase family protein [Solirubrobacteraceae bacterium]